MIINHNIPALNTYSRLSANNVGLAKSLEKLSSGLRINRAADDAAGLAISEKMRAQIRGLEQATRNVQDGISLIQTAEGALTESHSILQRMRQLTVQAANDTYTSNDRMEIQREINQLKEELDRISATTQFNAKNLLDGTSAALVSTDKISTRVFMRGGLRQVDQFGQKSPGGGNYRLEITADPGKNQIQKTDIFKIKHAEKLERTAIVNDNYGDGRFASIEVRGIVAGANNCGDGRAIFSLSFAFNDGCIISVNRTDLSTSTATNLSTLIQSCEALAARLCTVGSGTELVLTSKTSGANFTMTAILNETACESGTFTFGACMLSTCTTIQTGSISTSNGVYATTASGSDRLGGTVVCVVSTQATVNLREVNVCDTFMKVGYYGVNTDRNITEQNQLSCNRQFFSTSGVNSIQVSGTGVTCVGLNASVLIEIVSVDSACETASIRYMKHTMDKNGVSSSDACWTTATVCAGTLASLDLGSGLCMLCIIICDTINLTAGDKSVINITACSGATGAGNLLTITESINNGLTYTCVAHQVVVNCNALDNRTTTFNFFQINNTTGEHHDSSLDLTFGRFLHDENNAATFRANAISINDNSIIGKVADLNTKLYDIDRFWDSNGNFILDRPRTISIVQGSGKSVNVVLTSADTIDTVRAKINSAIGLNPPRGLGQSELVGTCLDQNFVSYVERGQEDASGFETVPGTFIIRSAMPGKEGELSFIGDDEVMRALSLMTIQKAESNTFTVNVYDAHDSTIIAENVVLTDNNLVGIINENIDVQFSSSTGLEFGWDANTKNFLPTGSNTPDISFIHVADNSMIFHIGANQQQDVMAAIGDMSVRSLGLENILVYTNELANQALSKIDGALGRVSSERAKLGAVQNRLEHTFNNLVVTAENITAAESRIRDVDMALEMLNFTKYNILQQAATAMLAQANQLPQSVLQLLR